MGYGVLSFLGCGWLVYGRGDRRGVSLYVSLGCFHQACYTVVEKKRCIIIIKYQEGESRALAAGSLACVYF